VTEQHYSLEPNPPGYEPAFDNDFLMHRFTCSVNQECLDDDICFQQFAKHINGPVPQDPSGKPDSNTGWGMQLEEGYSHRVCIVLLVGVVVSAVVGLSWSICVRDLQSGFVIASWIVTSEAVVVGSLQLLLFLRAI
jgi:hypothetical protein